jgi:hypothetical protein
LKLQQRHHLLLLLLHLPLLPATQPLRYQPLLPPQLLLLTMLAVH